MIPRRDRDQVLGAALRELRTPEHGPEFWPELEALLADQGYAAGAPEPARPGRPRPRGGRWVAAAVAAVAAVAALVVGVPETQTPTPALADVVRERVASAVAELRTLTGRGIYRASEPVNGVPLQRFRFALTAAGDLRLDALGAVDDRAYDAARGVERSINSSASLGGLGRFYAVRSGLAPGPPDLYGTEDFLERRLGSSVRALLAARDPRIEETTYLGRPAWTAVLSVNPNAVAADFDRVAVIVDQETGLPVLVRTSLEGSFHSALRLRDLRVNDGLGPGTFRIGFPPGAEVSRTDAGFRPTDLDDVEAEVGHAPVIPAAVPEGFEPAEAATARRAAPTGAEAGNPTSRGVVSQVYRRGFDRFTITTRLAGPDPARWGDPVAAGEGIFESRRRASVGGGAFAGTEAELVVGPRSIPHLWLVADGLVLTIAGDLTGPELVAVAESLEARAG